NNQSNRFSASSLGAAPRCSSQRTTSNSSRSSRKSQEGIPGISLRKLATLGISSSNARAPLIRASAHFSFMVRRLRCSPSPTSVSLQKSLLPRKNTRVNMAPYFTCGRAAPSKETFSAQ
ncbi:hypothetical protein IscW_ISCW006102, partial [Ixodes scapularis]